MAPLVRAKPRAFWVGALKAAGVPSAPVNTLAQAFADPQVVHRGMVRHVPFAATGTLPLVANPIRFSETPVRYDRPPPVLGEHTLEVCAELLGVSVEKLEALRAAGVI